jgi:alpha-glucosidase
MHRGDKTWGSGEKHGATNAAVKARIDFAAKYGFDGVLVEGWNIGWDGNWIDNGDLFSFTESYPDFDMAALSAYGAERDVKLIGHHETSGNVENYEAQMADAYDLYAQHGYEQIKTGYVAWAKELVRYDENGLTRYEWHDGQWAANHYLRTVTEAAKRKIAINTHEPIKDTGLRRTYPNWIAREGARGQEFNSPGAGGAGGDGVSTPDHNVNLVYTRMLSGPMDFTPGIFDLHYEKLDTPSKVKSTLAHQLALYVVLYSPIQMVPDYPEHYEQYPDAFQFIVDVPTDWEQSIALQGEMGDYVVFARQQRGGNDWYLGAITGTEARKLDLPLEFLERGSSYTAEIYRDGPTGHWDENQYDYIVERRVVTSEDRIEGSIGRAGGLAVRFIKQ